MVVDASVWVSRLLPGDVHHAASRRWLTEHLVGGGTLVAPTILFAEVAGAISRRTGSPDIGRRSIDEILSTPGLRVVPVDLSSSLVVARLAADLALRGSDAVYVAVARSLNVLLVTLDQEQWDRARTVITVLQP